MSKVKIGLLSVVAALALMVGMAGSALGASASSYKLGLLDRGMSKTEVLRRLGKPDDIRVEELLVSQRQSRSSFVSRPVTREYWYYSGDYGHSIPALITFSNGRLLDTEKNTELKRVWAR